MSERNRKIETKAEFRDPQVLRVHTLRHGPTNFNLEGKIQGNLQSVIQEDKIREYFDRVQASSLPQPEMIVVTGLVRTRQTAERLLEYNGWPKDLPIVDHPELNERKWGIFEGKVKEELRGLFLSGEVPVPEPFTLDQVRTMEDFTPLIDSPDFKVEGGESMREVAERIRIGLHGLREQYPGKQILLICHLGALKSVGVEARRITNMQVKKGRTGNFRVEAESEKD